MRILALLAALLVGLYLSMSQFRADPGADQPGQTIHQPQIERARGMQQQLQEDLDRRGAEAQQMLEGTDAPR